MTEKETPKRKHLRQDAADWFAAMRGPDADAQRPALEAWLAEDALHRAAYNQIAETFSLGKALKPAATSPLLNSTGQPSSVPPLPPSPRARRPLTIAAALVALLVGTISVGSLRFWRTGPLGPPEANSLVDDSAPSPGTGTAIRLSTETGRARAFTLPDGSSVALGDDSLILARLTGQRRDLQLLRGRARFTVAHDGRTFTVVAAGGSVTARGTVFDMALDSQKGVIVHLIEGRVDVAMPRTERTSPVTEPVKHLVAGELLGFGPSPFLPQTGPADAEDAASLHDVDKMRLGDLLAQANRGATIPILLDTPDLAELRVSGTFRIADSRKLADNLGIPLGLVVIDKGNAVALAHACPTKNRVPCRPLS